MGRDKDSSARKAGGRTSASSSGAAAMVAAMGAGGGLTFAAFDPNATSMEQDLDPDIALALKKLSKKDSTTKIKALGELLGFFEEAGGRTEDELKLVLPLWQHPFETVTMDADRRVREALYVALGALVVRVKKHMTKHLRGLILPWLCARFDTEASVRTAANAAFQALFPPTKIADALLYCKSDIVHGIDMNMAHTVQTLCDPKIFSKEDADETIARVHASSLLVLAHVLEVLSKEQAVKFGEFPQRLLSIFYISFCESAVCLSNSHQLFSCPLFCCCWRTLSISLQLLSCLLFRCCCVQARNWRPCKSPRFGSWPQMPAYTFGPHSTLLFVPSPYRLPRCCTIRRQRMVMQIAS
jgi:hypothetical protein